MSVECASRPTKVEVAAPVLVMVGLRFRGVLTEGVGERVVRLCESVVKGIPCRHGELPWVSHDVSLSD